MSSDSFSQEDHQESESSSYSSEDSNDDDTMGGDEDIMQHQDLESSSCEIVDKMFPPCRRSVAAFCTFGDHSQLRLKDSHVRKVSKYARRRLEKMNWNFLEEEPETLPKAEYHSDIELGDLLGEGSFSSVYVKQEQEDQVVKVLRTKLIHNPAMLAACAADLVKEGVLLAVLAGESNIVQIHGWQENGLHTLNNGFHDGFFLVLERLETTLGSKLKEWQKRKGKLSNLFNLRKKGATGQAKLQLLEERLQVIPHIARGIANMHKHGLIHRDLKPDNIGFANGQWKLFDLDVARLCPTYVPRKYCKAEFELTKRVGSPRYMAPETARGDRYNCQADVYSFALLVHELITLEKPYDSIPAELHDELIFYQHRRPDMSSQWPISLKYFLDSAWHKDWEERPILLDESFHNTLTNRILPEYFEYKQERYTPNKGRSSGFFSKKEKPQSVIPKNAVADLETSFSTTLTTSLRTDSRDVSPVMGRSH